LACEARAKAELRHRQPQASAPPANPQMQACAMESSAKRTGAKRPLMLSRPRIADLP